MRGEVTDVINCANFLKIGLFSGYFLINIGTK